MEPEEAPVMFSFLADVVLVSHVAFVLFVVVGGLLVLKRPWLARLHVPCALWGAWVEVSAPEPGTAAGYHAVRDAMRSQFCACDADRRHSRPRRRFRLQRSE